jgi:hypothetical protein
MNALATPTDIAISGTYYVKKETVNGCNDIQPVEVVLTTCSSTLDELEEKFKIQFYPNPVSEYMIVESEVDAFISISDNTGKELIREKLNSGTSELSVSAFVPGLYTLTFIVDQKNYTTVFVKK